MNNYQPMYNYGMYNNRPFNTYPYQSMPNVQQTPAQQPIQPVQPIQPQQIVGLQGKSVDSIEVVKAMDIPLDGSISYFPIADGSSIVTKQLQSDGTSKTIIYRPVDEKATDATPKYITEEKLEEILRNNNNDEFDTFRKSIKDISREIEDITSDISEIKKTIKDRKDK